MYLNARKIGVHICGCVVLLDTCMKMIAKTDRIPTIGPYLATSQVDGYMSTKDSIFIRYPELTLCIMLKVLKNYCCCVKKSYIVVNLFNELSLFCPNL